jgi:glutamyl-tRNA reductase
VTKTSRMEVRASGGSFEAEMEMSAPDLAALRLLSLNHQRVSFSELDRFSLGPVPAAALHDELRSLGISAVILATCNRTEVYWQSRGERDDREVQVRFEASAGLPDGADLLHGAAGENAARHLFRVASGLDSLLVGESEILGQVNDALAQFGRDDLVAGVFRAAVRCGRHARSETEIGTGALSVASAAVRRLVAVAGDLSRSAVVVVGAGSTGLKMARQLRKRGVERLVLVNRTRTRAADAAPALGAVPAGLDELPRWLAEADVVAVASHAPEPLVTEDMVRKSLEARGERALVILDLSMPRGVDPAVAALPGVTLHDLSQLEELVNENLERRRLEIPRVEAVVDRELDMLRAWARHVGARPILIELRAQAERIRQAELARFARERTTDGEAIDRLTRRLTERLLSIPAAIARDDRPSSIDPGGRSLGRDGAVRDESS